MHLFGFMAAGIAVSLAATGFAQTNVTLRLQVYGKPRSCVVHVPGGIDKPPLVFFVHRANGSGASGIWEDMQGTGNFPFFQAVIDTLGARYRIDRNRIYMTGFSQGGFISFVAACFHSDVLAAVAPVSGHSMAACTPKRAVPMFMTFGATEGPASFVRELEACLKLNSGPSTPTITRPFPASNPNSKATRVSYAPCAQGTSLVMDSISGLGYQWPGSSNLVQADEVWAFFKPYSLNSASNVQPRKVSSSHISASYASEMVRLRGVGEVSGIPVTDMRGRLVEAATTRRGRFRFKDKPSGVYVATVSRSGRQVTRKFMVP